MSFAVTTYGGVNYHVGPPFLFRQRGGPIEKTVSATLLQQGGPVEHARPPGKLQQGGVTGAVSPQVLLRGGVLEIFGLAVALNRAGVISLIAPTQSHFGGVVEKVSPTVKRGFGVLEKIGYAVRAEGGVAEAAAVFIRLEGGVLEILAPEAALTSTFYSFVLNTKTAGFGAYANFPFTSLFKVGTNFYGITADGLYQLTGDSDNGAEIQAAIVTGHSNLGSSDVKRFPSAYAHMRGGEIEVSTKIDEDEEWMEPENAFQDREGLRPEYISMARGIKGVYIQLKIKNADGSDFSLAKFEQNFVDTGRKRG